MPGKILRMRCRLFQYVFLAAALAVTGCRTDRAVDPVQDREGLEFFENRIRPVLVERCYKCHSQQFETQRGNLRLDSRAGWLKGGQRGKSIVPGEPEKSPLIRAIRWQDDDFKMPPDKRLSDEQVADFVAWVQRGAPAP